MNNDQLSERFENAVMSLKGYDKDVPRNLIDLLTHAMHWCKQNGEDFDWLLALACHHFLNDQQKDEPTQRRPASQAEAHQAACASGPFTYHRDRDGCDETWDICGPGNEHLVSIPFWEKAAETEATARFIVHRLNTYDVLMTSLTQMLISKGNEP